MAKTKKVVKKVVKKLTRAQVMKNRKPQPKKENAKY